MLQIPYQFNAKFNKNDANMQLTKIWVFVLQISLSSLFHLHSIPLIARGNLLSVISLHLFPFHNSLELISHNQNIFLMLNDDTDKSIAVTRASSYHIIIVTFYFPVDIISIVSEVLMCFISCSKQNISRYITSGTDDVFHQLL